jgi:hypothetical protein
MEAIMRKRIGNRFNNDNRGRRARGNGKGGMAAVLSFFIPGLGHLYAGRILTGLGIMGSFPVALLLIWGVGPAAIYGTADPQGGGNAARGLLALALFFGLPVLLWVGQIYLAYLAAERRR